MNMRRGHGGHDDREEDETKMGFIFQINEMSMALVLNYMKKMDKKKGPNHIDYLPPSSSLPL